MRTLIKLVLLFTLLLIPVAVQAQSISSNVTYCGPRCVAGYFVENEGKRPMTFSIVAEVVNPKPIQDPADLHLAEGVQVRVSEIRGRLGPYEVRRIRFSIRCEALPCTVKLTNTFDTAETIAGIPVRIITSHLVHVDAKTRDVIQKEIMTAGFPVSKPAQDRGKRLQGEKVEDHNS